MSHPAPVPAELMRRVNAILAGMPETRRDRVEQAKASLQRGPYSASDVASKIIARSISDSLR